MYKYRNFKRLILVLLFSGIMTVLTGFGPVRAEGDKYVDFSVSYGFEGNTKIGSHTPITVSVYNEGEAFRGSVQVLLSSYLGSEWYSAVDSSILGTRNKDKNYLFEKPADIAAVGQTDVTIAVPLLTKSNTMKITVLDEQGDILCSGEKIIEVDDYSYYIYAGILSDDPKAGSIYRETSIYQYDDYTVKTVLLAEQDIPEELYGLDMFDVLIVSDNMYEKLNKKQREEVDRWEKNEGILYKTDSETDALPYVWKDIIPDEILRDLNMSQYYKYWAVANALGSVYMGKLPVFPLFAIVLVVYIVLAGPGLYLLLKKFKKQQYFWAGEIICSLVFSFLVIGLGSRTRLTAPFINYFNILTCREDRIENSYYFNIRAPYNNEYKLYLDPSYSVVPVYDQFYSYDPRKYKNVEDYRVGIVQGEEENTITIRNNPAFEREHFYAEQVVKATDSRQLQVNVSLFGNSVMGEIVNPLDYPIEHAALFAYNKVIFLGTIEAGETVSLDGMEVFTFNPKFRYGLSEQAIGKRAGKPGLMDETDMEANQKKRLLDFYLDQRFAYHNKNMYLTGFPVIDNQFKIQLDSGYQAYGSTLLEVPVKACYEREGFTYTTYVPIKNEEYSTSGDLMYSGEMVLTYNLGEKIEDIQLFFNELSFYDESYYRTFSGRIYFYNHETTLYDPMELSQKIMSGDELAPYLNESNDLVIKYVEEFSEGSKEVLLPSLSTAGRIRDAEN